jgi:hypothetical protein
MFYDTGKPINLNQNEIAESAHFFFPGSLLPTVPGTTPSSSHHTISAGAAGVVGAVITLAVVAVCLLAYIFCYRKRQRIAENAADLAAIDPGPEKSYFKPELEGREYENVASKPLPAISQEMQVSASPLPVLSDRSELTASTSARHELYDNTQGYYSPQMPASGTTSQIPRSELQTQSPQNKPLPTIKRKEIGGT